MQQHAASHDARAQRAQRASSRRSYSNVLIVPAHSFVARLSEQLWVACAQSARSALALSVLAPDAFRRARLERGIHVAPTTSPYKHSVT